MFADADALNSEFPKLVVYYLENEEVYSEYYCSLVRERAEKVRHGSIPPMGNTAGRWRNRQAACLCFQGI